MEKNNCKIRLERNTIPTETPVKGIVFFQNEGNWSNLIIKFKGEEEIIFRFISSGHLKRRERKEEIIQKSIPITKELLKKKNFEIPFIFKIPDSAPPSLKTQIFGSEASVTYKIGLFGVKEGSNSEEEIISKEIIVLNNNDKFPEISSKQLISSRADLYCCTCCCRCSKGYIDLKINFKENKKFYKEGEKVNFTVEIDGKNSPWSVKSVKVSLFVMMTNQADFKKKVVGKVITSKVKEFDGNPLNFFLEVKMLDSIPSVFGMLTNLNYIVIAHAETTGSCDCKSQQVIVYEPVIVLSSFSNEENEKLKENKGLLDLDLGLKSGFKRLEASNKYEVLILSGLLQQYDINEGDNDPYNVLNMVRPKMIEINDR